MTSPSRQIGDTWEFGQRNVIDSTITSSTYSVLVFLRNEPISKRVSAFAKSHRPISFLPIVV